MNDFLQNLRNGQAEKQRTAKTRKNYDNSYHYNNQRFHSYGGYQNTRPQNPNVKRQPGQPGTGPFPPEEATMDILAESIENLSIHIETLAKNQEFLINAQDRAADMLERQANAIEEIVRYLHVHINPSEESSPVEAPAEEQVTFRQVEDEIENEIEEEIEASDDTELLKRSSYRKEEKPAQILKKSKKGGVTRKINIPDNDTPAVVQDETGLLSRDTIMGIINSMRKEGATFDQVAKHLVDLGQPTFSGRGEWHAQTIHRLCNKKK